MNIVVKGVKGEGSTFLIHYKKYSRVPQRFFYIDSKSTPYTPYTPYTPVIGLKMSAKSGLACGLAGLGTINQFNNPNSV